MVGFTDRVSQGVLNHITGKTALFTLATPMYVALFTAIGSDNGTGFTEVSGGSYARVAMAAGNWNTATGTSPSTVTNSVAATFPASTAAWGTIIAWGLYDAASGGNLLCWDYLGSGAWAPFSASLASPSILTSPAHGFAAGTLVVVSAEFGGALPTGGTFTGLLTVASPTTDTFNTGVNATASGDGLVRAVVPLVIGSSGITPSLPVGNITLVSS